MTSVLISEKRIGNLSPFYFLFFGENQKLSSWLCLRVYRQDSELNELKQMN